MAQERDPASAGVSVIIACHTEARWDSLLRTIKSVQAQNPSASEIIVAVDHNERLYQRLADEQLGIELVSNQGLRGAAAARNLAAAEATQAVLVFLDDDVEARDGWLTALLAPLADPQVVGTGGRTLPAWQAGRPSWFPDEFGWVVGASYAGLPDREEAVRNVWSENMAIRHEAFDAAGGFRAGFGKVGLVSLTEDDTDLCIRVAAISPGSKWIYVPTAVVDHEVPAERSTFSYFLYRTYLEGVGKIRMSRLLGTGRELATERDHLLTLPVAAVRAAGSGKIGRALAIVLGVAAAAVGAAFELLTGPRQQASI
jgi:glucosyl-dolichyl phosphate glucuronosyltransferase